jgi:hypothetical protein
VTFARRALHKLEQARQFRAIAITRIMVFPGLSTAHSAAVSLSSFHGAFSEWQVSAIRLRSLTPVCPPARRAWRQSSFHSTPTARGVERDAQSAQRRCPPRLDLFSLVVAENGALLYWPETRSGGGKTTLTQGLTEHLIAGWRLSGPDHPERLRRTSTP